MRKVYCYLSPFNTPRSHPYIHKVRNTNAQMLTGTGTEQVLVFQKTDGTGEDANGTAGVPFGQGLHVETDPDDRPACVYIVSQDVTLQH